MKIAIKSSLRRDDFQIDAKLLYRGLLDSGYVELPATDSHAAAITSLPPIHRDPFDRILVAQAMTEHLTLVTADETVAHYSSAIRLVYSDLSCEIPLALGTLGAARARGVRLQYFP